MIDGVHHINFLVRNLESAIPAWERALGRPVDRRDELAGRNMISARFDVGGTWIVLVQPNRPGTPPAVHLERHGEGFFLLSLETDSLEDEVRRLGESTFDGRARDGERCANPGCGTRQNLQAHHIRYRADGGRTVLQNEVALCRTCHTLIHAGLVEVERTETGELHWRRRVRPPRRAACSPSVSSAARARRVRRRSMRQSAQIVGTASE